MTTPAADPSFTRTKVGLILVVIVICAIQVALPSTVTIGPSDFIPLAELAGIPVVLGLTVLAPGRHAFVRKAMSFFLGLLVAATVMNALLLLWTLLASSDESGVVLLFAGFGVLAINVLSFGIVYWWIDTGAPALSGGAEQMHRAFLFPQQGMAGHEDWHPSLTDYLFTAYTNIIAFSPTDTMPLTHRVKTLFIVQSSTALLTIVITLSRAINLIPGGPTIGS